MVRSGRSAAGKEEWMCGEGHAVGEDMQFEH